jgi:dipeptidyl-peptidase-4
LWPSERDGYNHLYRYRIDGTLINRVTSGNWSMRASRGVYWVSGAVCAVDEKAGLVYFTALKKSSIERHLYRANMDGKNLERISRQDGVHKIAFSPKTHYYLDEFSDRASPPALLLYRNDGTLLFTLAESPGRQLDKYHMQFREFFSIAARDGFEMPAYFIRPSDFNPQRKYPVIIYIYGGPSAPQVVDQWDDNNYFDNILVKDGYLIFCMDNRSASGISKTLQLTVLKDLWGDVELHDLLDAVQWLKKQSFTDTSRIGIWGWSGGGMHTLLAMTRSTEFKAGIAVAPVSDWIYYDTRYTEFAMKRPQDNPEGYWKTSLVRRAKNLHGRLLLVYGTYDDNVHPQNSQAFANELIRNNVQFDMMVYPMRKHTIDDDRARIHLYTRMREFWRENL